MRVWFHIWGSDLGGWRPNAGIAVTFDEAISCLWTEFSYLARTHLVCLLEKGTTLTHRPKEHFWKYNSRCAHNTHSHSYKHTHTYTEIHLSVCTYVWMSVTFIVISLFKTQFLFSVTSLKNNQYLTKTPRKQSTQR